MLDAKHELEIITFFKKLEISSSEFINEYVKKNRTESKNILLVSNLKYFLPHFVENPIFNTVSCLRIMYCKEKRSLFREDAYLEFYGFHETGEVYISKDTFNINSKNPEIIKKYKTIGSEDIPTNQFIQNFFDDI